MDVVIKKEKDCSWLEESIDRTCEWCSSPDFMRTDLPNYINKPLDGWPADLLLDLCYCYDCVQEYHRLQEELTEHKQKKLLQSLDVDRLKRTITSALENAVETVAPLMQDIATKLQVPLLEMLRFPYFLHDYKLALLFKRGLIALDVFACPLKLEEKLPGTYLLLVHPDPEVRGWAVKSVRGQGMINPDEYDLLKEVIKWMIDVVEFNLFEYSDLMAPGNNDATLPFDYLPSHLFIPLTIKEYWMGLLVLLMRMDEPTVQSCFMSYTGHMDFLNAIVLPMENQEGEAFWPMLQCFVVLLERLAQRIWQISEFTYNPHQLFRIITENCFFHNAIMQWQNHDGRVNFNQEVLRQRARSFSSSSDTKSSGFYNTALKWFHPFVISLLDFDYGGHCLSLVIKYLHEVADMCSPGNTFKSDVQSALLTIISELLAKRMFMLLAPTVHIWAKDMVDFVITEMGDNKMVEATRKLLQHLLKAGHRLGYKHALKYWDVFRLPGPKQLSADDKQLIISLLVRNFEAQPSFQVAQSGCVTKSKDFTNAKDGGDNKPSHQSSLPTEGLMPVKKEKAQTSHDECDSDGVTAEKSGVLANREKFRSRVKPGPSSRVTSSEDEDEDEEDNFWSRVKRRKKPKDPLRNIKVSKLSSELGLRLMEARVPLIDCSASLRKVKTEKSVHHAALQTTARPKRRNSARKSAGRPAKFAQAPTLQKSGATAADPIVLSDEEESATDISEQKKPVSAGDERPGYLDDYLNYESIQDDDIALIQLMDEVDPTPNSGKTQSEIKQSTTAKNSSTPVAIYSDSEKSSSDEDLYCPAFESRDKVGVKVKSEETEMDYENASRKKIVAGESGDKINSKNIKERDDFSSPSVRRSESPCSTFYPSRIQTTNVTTSLVKTESADSGNNLDDKPLSSYLPSRPFKTSVKALTHDISANVKSEAMVSERNTASDDEVMDALSVSTLIRDTDCGVDKPEEMGVDHNTSSFANATDIASEGDYIMDGCSDAEEETDRNSSHLGQDAPPIFPRVKPEPMAQGEENTHSLSVISEKLQNDALFDDVTNFWGDYSELVLNSQENALASVEEDLEDLYGTQTENQTEDDSSLTNADVNNEVTPDEDTLPSVDVNDKITPDEDVHRAKPKKHVTFAIDASSSDAVASSSRPASNQMANTKPTRALSEDVFFREILSWRVEHFLNSQSNGRSAPLPQNYSAGRVPECFTSMDEYYKIFKPLLFMEIWQQALGSWGDKVLDRKIVTMDVLDGSNANSFWIIPCNGFMSEQQQKKALFPMESDLVLLTRSAADGRGGSDNHSAVFGFVEKAEVKRVQPSRRESIGSSGGEEEFAEAKFELTLSIKTTSNFRPVRKSRLQVEFVTSLLTALRQWSALMQFSKSLLAGDILRPRKADYFCSGDYRQTPHVAKNYNESQEKVISTAANAVHKPYPIPRICLVQGPPGTGKSYTIVGLVKEILNRVQEMPGQATASSSNGSIVNKVRILLCAPSNAAIDELIGRLTEAQIRLHNRHDNKENRRCNRQDDVKRVQAISSNCGDLCLVRVGRKSHIHPNVMKFSLESMTKQILDQSSSSATEDNLNKTKESLRTINGREKQLERDIKNLKSSPHTPDELEKLEKEKENLKVQKRTLEKSIREERAKQANKRRKESSIRREILFRADVICTTLSGAGSSSLKQDLAGRPVCPPFTCVIVDEACQSNELDLLIPLCFQASKLVLVGDPEQLPCTVLSVKAKEKFFGRSMFERLYKFFRHHKEEMEKPVLMLEEQYRMHPEIAVFPSSHVYSNCLRSHRSLEKRPFPLLKHYALFDVVYGEELCQDRGALWNADEADVIVNLCCDLTKILHAESIGIVTPYRKQKNEIQERLASKGLSRGTATIEVNTVDGFQGREKDVIILSCVRAQQYRGSIGFLTDKQRMNVALTRARHALYVFGHMETLKGGSPDWKALIEDAEKRGCLFHVESPADVRSVLSIGATNNILSPAKDPRLKNIPHDFHRSSTGDRAVDHRCALGDMSTSRSAVECNDREEVTVPRNGRHQVEERVNASPEMSKETSNFATAINENSTSSEPSSNKRVDGLSAQNSKVANSANINGKGKLAKEETYPSSTSTRVNGHSTERKKVVNSAHKDREGKPGKEGARLRDRDQQETKEDPRHRARSDDLHHRHMRHGQCFDQRDRQRHETGKESKHSSRQHSTHHSSRHDRVEGNANHEKQRGPSQRRSEPDARVRYQSHCTTTSLDKNGFSNTGEGNSNDPSLKDTHNVSSHFVIETSSHPDYDEKNSYGAYIPPSQSRKMPDARIMDHSETATTLTDDNDISDAEEIDSDDALQLDAPNPMLHSVIQHNATHRGEYFVQLYRQEKEAAGRSSPAQRSWSPVNTGSPTEEAVTRAPILSESTSSSISLASSWFSTSFSPSIATGATTSFSTVSSATTPMLSKSLNDVGRSVEKPANASLRKGPGTGSGSSCLSSRPTTSRSSNVFNTLGRSSEPPSLKANLEANAHQHRSLGAAAGPSSSKAYLEGNAPLYRPQEATSGSYNVSSRANKPGLSKSLNIPSRSFEVPPMGLTHSLDRRRSTVRGELDPSAQEAAEAVRLRHPPAPGPQVIPATNLLRNPHGGTRKRKAHVGTTDVSALRGRVGREVDAPTVPPRPSTVPPRRNSLKKARDNFRGRKNWK